MDNEKDCTCQICGKKFLNPSKVVEHLKKYEDTTVKGYFLKYYNKHDLYTGEPLIYKDWESYLRKDFNNYSNFKNWCLSGDSLTVTEYLKKKLIDYIYGKDLDHLPCTVELKSLDDLPNIHLIEKVFGDKYDKLFSGLVENQKFKYNKKPFKVTDELIKIRVDSREQKPLDFVCADTFIEKVEGGDYERADKHVPFVFERKSLNDFLNTMTGGYPRFCRQIEKNQDKYIVVIVEDTLSRALSFKYRTYNFNMASAGYVFYRVRETLRKYKNIQYLFVSSREESSKIIENMFRSNIDPSTTDLQYYYDKGILK